MQGFQLELSGIPHQGHDRQMLSQVLCAPAYLPPGNALSSIPALRYAIGSTCKAPVVYQHPQHGAVTFWDLHTRPGGPYPPLLSEWSSLAQLSDS